MNSLRKAMSEAVVIRGSNKYMSRGGKFYHYDKDGNRTEISKEDYEEVLGPRVQGRPDVGAKAQNKHSIALSIDGRKYSASVDGMTAKDLAAHVQAIAKHSPGRAIQWLKKNGTIKKVGEKAPQTNKIRQAQMKTGTAPVKDKAFQRKINLRNRLFDTKKGLAEHSIPETTPNGAEIRMPKSAFVGGDTKRFSYEDQYSAAEETLDSTLDSFKKDGYRLQGKKNYVYNGDSAAKGRTITNLHLKRGDEEVTLSVLHPGKEKDTGYHTVRIHDGEDDAPDPQYGWEEMPT